MNKRIKITSLTTTVLASLILAGANVNNVKADTITDNATTAKAQTPEDQAKANISAAQNDVTTAEGNVSSAAANLDKAKSDAAGPDKAYADQNQVVESAKSNADSKNQVLQDANDKKADAEELADEAKRPGAIEDAKKAVSDKQSEIDAKNKELEATQGKTGDAQKAVDKANQDLEDKNKDLQTAKDKKSAADKQVSDAANALNNTNFDEVNDNLNKANTAVEKDDQDLKNIGQKISQDQTAEQQAKTDADLAQKAVDDAQKVKDAADKDYNNKKSASDKANADVKAKNGEIGDLQKELDHVNDLNNEQNENKITIKDQTAYRQAYADYMNGNLTDEDEKYLDSAINDNKYVSSDKAAQEKIDPNNLTTDQIQELSLFTTHLFNDLRQQLGLTPNDVVTDGSISYAKQVADAYRKDNWSINDNDGHDCEAINKLADQNGLKSYAEMKGDEPGDAEDDNKYSQPYEDAYTVANLDHTPQTMDDLREYVFTAANAMIFGSGKQYEFDHARGILGAVQDSPEIKAEQDDTKSDEIKKLKEALSDNEDDIPASEANPDGSLVLELKQAKEDNKRYKEYQKENQENPDLVDYYDKLIKESQALIDNLPQEIENKREELAKLEAGDTTDTTTPHYVATEFVSLNDGTEFQVHFLDGMTPSDIKDSSKFSTNPVTSYDEQQANDLNEQIGKAKTALTGLQQTADKLSSDTAAAKNKLDDAQKTLNSKQNNLTSANNNYTNAQRTLNTDLQTQKDLKSQKETDLKAQKDAKDSFDAFQGNHQQLVNNYNSAVQKQKDADQAVKTAQTAVETAQKNLDQAKQAQSDLNKDIEKKQQAVTDAQNELKQLQDHESSLENASQILNDATNAQEKAQQAYDDAKKQVDDAEAALKKLQPAKDAADQKVSEAQSAYDNAVAELSAAQEKLANAKASLEKIQQEQAVISKNHNNSTNKTHKNGNSSKKTGYKLVRLTHNAFVYDKHGKATRNGLHFKLIKKGKQIKALNNAKVVTINGQKFYQIAKNEFVKVNNTKFKTRSVHFKARVKGLGKAYTRAGKYNNHHVSTRKTYTFNEKVTVNGKTYYKISWTNNWIPASKLSLKK